MIKMTYAEILSYHFNKRFNIYEFNLKYGIKPLPGQFVNIVFPNEKEVPLSVGDYKDGILTLYIESEKLAKELEYKRRVIVKGPLGKALQLNVKSILGIAKTTYNYLEISYVLKEGERKGIKTYLNCEECGINSGVNDADLIIASVPETDVNRLPHKALVYVRWVKMNCGLGVCGVCAYKGFLPCIEGPFIEVSKIVGKG
jgi:hypothetical protein